MAARNELQEQCAWILSQLAMAMPPEGGEDQTDFVGAMVEAGAVEALSAVLGDLDNPAIAPKAQVGSRARLPSTVPPSIHPSILADECK